MTGTFTALAGPHLRHRLLWALRCRDGFTGAVIERPLLISVPELGLSAVRGRTEPSYRLLIDERRPFPPGPEVGVTIVDPIGAYVLLDALTLPRAHPAVMPLPPQLADYIREVTLWPTRLLSLPVGETAVVGRLRSNAGAPLVGRRVAMARAAVAPAGTPSATTDGAGEFLIRLPGVRRATPSETFADLAVAVTNGAAAVALASITPAGAAAGTARVDISRSTFVALTAA